MTPTERKALAAWNEVRRERGLTLWPFTAVEKDTSFAAICRLIDEHEAFKQEVSDAVWAMFDGFNDAYCPYTFMHEKLDCFIIPKPDPVAEWLHKSGYAGNADVEQAVRAFAKEQGE